MKIGFYDPYLDSLGGGERYVLTLASHWSAKHQVFIFWDNPNIITEAKTRFNLNLSNVQITRNIFAGRNLLYKLWLSKNYDLIFFLSDGSIPTSLAKLNILHFQTPFPKISACPFKLGRFQAVVTNSEFTKNNLDPQLKLPATVIYPPVEPIPTVEGLNKEKIILSVGRFTDYHQAKKQEVMIRAFISLENDLPKWQLVLIGGMLATDKEYLAELLKISRGHRIKLLPNIDYNELVKFYRQASIYWHAAGFGETDPRFMEHFGISTVEAMSAGAVPLVYDGGGQREIVRDGVNGCLWKSESELIAKTQKILLNKVLYHKLQYVAKDTARRFSETNFNREFDEFLQVTN